MKAHLRMSLLLAGVVVLISDARVLAHTDLTVEQARDLIASTAGLVVVDVREPSEFCDARGHIPGALNYPLTSGVLQARYAELPMDRPILVVCRSGGRSSVAANFLDAKGIPEVYDMNGGMNAWLWDTVPCKYAGGSGTADDPYQIATAADLIALGETPEDYDKHFILTADIDLDPNLPGRKVFDRAVIASDTNDVEPGFQGTAFVGVFDGDDHTISNLTIVGVSHLGLFGAIETGVSISRLGLVAVDVNGTGTHVGALLGGGTTAVGDGSITASYSTGVVTGTALVGGVVGLQPRRSQITVSYSMATVRGSDYVGGLAGVNFGSLTNCYAGGHVTGSGHVGGLAGQNGCRNRGANDYGTITHCYSGCRVSADGQPTGGLVGLHDFGEVTASFWDIDTSGHTSSDGGQGLSTTEMQAASTFLEAGWDFVGETENGTEEIWWIDEGNDYPRLWWERETREAEGVVELSAPDFDAQIAEGVALVDFYATWCSFCDLQTPILDEVAERLGGQARVAKLDVDEARDIMQRYDITGVPTLILFRDGLVVERFVGLTDADTLVAAVLSVVESQV